MIRSRRIRIVHALLAIFALAIAIQAARVELLQGRTWQARAARQHLSSRALPAPRGDILDATGLVLAQSRDMVQLELAPREVRDRDRDALRSALLSIHMNPEWIDRAIDSPAQQEWLTLPGRYLPTDVATLTAIRGVHSTPVSVRGYSLSDGARSLVGHVDASNNAVDGIELALDSTLRGTPGAMTLVRDLRGSGFESPSTRDVAPRPGNTLVLTLNDELQEIAEHALADAILKMRADGGDVVVLDPRDGDILAMASRRRDLQLPAATALTEPFEPGSTLKPFIAAGLLARGRARETDIVSTGDGVLELEGRVIHDDHLVGNASLATVLQYSSNIGIVKFALRLTRHELFDVLHDFGFGKATGVSYPAEANGVLRPPSLWSAQSPASLAMGYEISVTPLQLAAAYAVLANGGELLQPTLVREIRAPDNTVLYRHRKRVVRRVLSPAVANRVRTMLLNVVEHGTAVQADLSGFLLAGKTGTPRRTMNGRYVPDQYNPNFVGLFPGDSPQFVVVVKLINAHDEKGSFYSASTAAPLTRTVLEAALAARDAGLDRRELISSAAARKAPRPVSAAVPTQEFDAGETLSSAGEVTTGNVWRLARARQRLLEEVGAGSVPSTISLSQQENPPPAHETHRRIPDVRGMSLRDAVLTLHHAGFHVKLVPGGTGLTDPPAGSLVRAGTLVRIFHDF